MTDGVRAGHLIGEHRRHDQCRFCLGRSLMPFIDFGDVPLAGGFLRKGSTDDDFRNERRYPLQVHVCRDCALVQVTNVVAGPVLFSDYFYFSSAIGTLAEHFRAYAAAVGAAFPAPGRATLLELGCNDGVFLRPLAAQGFNVIGVDPATNVVAPLVADGFDIVNDFFTYATASAIRASRGAVDAIFTSNSFAHIDDMHDVMRGVKALLAPDGYLAFEVHYLGTMLAEMQYDMIYHEHLSYYSLGTIDRFVAGYDMEVFDVLKLPIHGGSVRFSVQSRRTGSRPVTERVQAMRAEEAAAGVGDPETYAAFGRRVARTRTDLLSLLDSLKSAGKSIVGYGASGRATTLSAYCGLDRRYLDAVIDDAPAKQGAFTPGAHLPIVSSAILAGPQRPDYALLFAWTFADEIKKRNADFLAHGGRFIVPLPAVRLLEG